MMSFGLRMQTYLFHLPGREIEQASEQASTPGASKKEENFSPPPSPVRSQFRSLLVLLQTLRRQGIILLTSFLAHEIHFRLLNFCRSWMMWREDPCPRCK